MITITELEDLIKNHDISYLFSDDDDIFSSGLDEFNAIRILAKNFDKVLVEQMWDSYVDKKIADDEARQFFYWKKLNPS